MNDILKSYILETVDYDKDKAEINLRENKFEGETSEDGRGGEE